MARGHRSAWFPLLFACRFVEFDTSIICHVLVYWFLLISIARYIFKSPRICFWGTKYDVYRERVVYLHYILWRRAWLWLELSASTPDKFFWRVSYLPSHVFLRSRRSFTSRPATDEIHMEDRNHGLAWTKPNSDIYNTQHSQHTCALRVNFKSCDSRTIKGERTLYIELQKFSSIR